MESVKKLKNQLTAINLKLSMVTHQMDHNLSVLETLVCLIKYRVAKETQKRSQQFLVLQIYLLCNMHGPKMNHQ